MTNRGHDRWARAALNAVRKPHTQAAALYRTRVAFAELVAHELVAQGGHDAVYGYFRDGFEYARTGSGTYVSRDVLTRLETYCSTYCMAMCMQLNVGDRVAVAGIKAALAAANEPRGDRYTRYFLRALRAGELKRAVKCQCCGTAVR